MVGGRTAFSRRVHDDVQNPLAESSAGNPRLVSGAMLAGLPEPVQRCLQYTGTIGTPFVRTVQFSQRLFLASAYLTRADPDESWAHSLARRPMAC